MSHDRPRYAPRSAYRTRSSSVEVGDSEDLATTALDRPVVDLSRAAQSRAPANAPVMGEPRGRAPLAWLPFVLLLGLGAGVTCGTVLACCG